MSNLIIITDSEEEDTETTEELIEQSVPYYTFLTDKLSLEIRAQHQLAVQHALTHANEPILFLVESLTKGGTKLFAWYPTGTMELCKMVLDVFCITLREATQLENHCTLVECFIGLSLITSKMDLAKKAARDLLKQCFGTFALGPVKRVIRPSDRCERAPGEMDFYLLPMRLQCYTLLEK